jgi:hypothetical protein
VVERLLGKSCCLWQTYRSAICHQAVGVAS